MKLALISTNVLPSTPWSDGFQGYGGLEPLVGELAKGLAHLGHDVHLFASVDTKAEGVFIEPYPKGAGEEVCFNEYRKLVGQFDVVQDHTWSHWPVIGFMQDGHHKTKLQVFHHGVLAGISSRPPVTAHWTAFSHAQSVYVGASLGIPCRYVHHGIPLELYPLQEAKEDYYVMLTRLSPEKGVIPAVEMLRRHGKRVVVVADDRLIAIPSYVAEFKRLVDGKQVVFVPGNNLSHEDKIKWLAGARALVTAPQYPWVEIFGLSVVEAMACGTPVLALRNGALPELIAHEQTGYLADTVEGLADYLECLTSISPAGCRIRADALFSASRMASEHERLLTDIMAGKSW
ncbi:MAG: glycosyltransferase [Dehalococcoidia bacterium]|nr:glycosyltransferase [Dehalococcoidia bacterium]